MNKDKIDAFLAGPNRKKGDLRQAYELARDPTSWNEEQNTIVRNYEQSLQDAADEEEENQDQLEEDDEDDEQEEEEPSSKKRKRGAEAGKIRESADKRKKSKAAEAAAKPKADKPISHNKGTTNGDAQSKESLDPETKKVKEWRHKVQKVFLGKDATINPEDMPSADATFKTVEEYDGMTAEHLRTTKIGKVMKRVMQLSEIPRDDEFHFKDRAEKLCAKWGAIMAGGDSTHAKEENESTKENGNSNGNGAAETEEHAAEEAKPEAESAPAATANADEEPATTESS